MQYTNSIQVIKVNSLSSPKLTSVCYVLGGFIEVITWRDDVRATPNEWQDKLLCIQSELDGEMESEMSYKNPLRQINYLNQNINWS